MPNKKISELPAAGALTGAELIETVQGGVNVQTTTQDIANLGGGGGTWGTIGGTLANQTDLQNALNDKSDAGATISAKVGAYTLLAADLTLVNAGATLIIDGDSSADLTVPLNSSVAFPVGSFIGVRDFNNVVATGGVTITGTSGSLAIPSGMTATLEKTATDTWILHNGAAAGVVTADIVGVQDLYIPATAMWPRTTNGCSEITKREIATSLFNIQTLNFDATTQEFCQFSIVLPRKYNLGTFTYEILWTAASGSGTADWGVSGAAYSNDDALTGALGSAVTVNDTLTAVDDFDKTPTSSAVTLGGTPADADLIVIQISRNPGSDTLAVDAEFIGIHLHITTDAAIDA